MAKKKVKKTKNSALTVLIAVIFFFVAYMLVFFLGRNRGIEFRKNKNKNETVELKKYDVDVVTIPVNNENVVLAMKNYDSFRLDEEYYHYDAFELENVSMYQYIVAGLGNIGSDNIAYCINDESALKQPITIDVLNEGVHKIADINISMEDVVNNAKETSNKVGNVGYGYYSLKIDGNNIYVVGACDEKKDTNKPFYTKVTRAEEFADYLNIYQRVAFGVVKNGSVYYYNNYQREGGALEVVDVGTEPDFSKHTYALYKITFIKEGDKYYFQGLESR